MLRKSLSAVDRSALLRILDANANRAREALRVMEDYVRFGHDNSALSEQLKTMRHGLAEALRGFSVDGLLQRDTPGDVGTAISTPGEAERQSVADIVTAAGKRLSEALRSIEECLKALDPAAAAQVEQLRYAGYSVEQSIGRLLRPGGRFADVRLYVLITESACKRPWLGTAEAALAGGADCLQLREKSLDGAELLRRARQLRGLCQQHDALLIINDRVDIAALSQADGVHLGQDDLPATEARRLLGDAAIIGVSTHNIEQARQARADGADYIGVGPVYRSDTKPRNILPGLAYAQQAAREIDLPGVAIAGITLERVPDVMATGIGAVAVTAAVTQADDPQQATADFKAAIAR